MRILLQSLRHFSKPGGSTTYCLRVAEELQRIGHDVTGLCQEVEPSLANDTKVETLRFSTHAPVGSVFWRVPEFLRARRYFPVVRDRCKDAELILAWNYAFALATKRVWPDKWVFYVAPSIVSRHWPFDFENYTPVRKILSRLNRYLVYRTERDMLDSVDAVLCSSNRLRTSLSEWFGHRRKHWYVCPFGTDDVLARAPQDRTSVRRGLGIPETVPLVITVSVLDPNKNTVAILKAVAKARNHDVHLLVVGDGQERDSLACAAHEMGIAHRVRFAGYVQDPSSLYAAADMFALASKYESFGMVYLEAMISRLPVLGPRHSTETYSVLSEIIEEGVSGFACERTDIGALAAKIDLLANDVALRTTMGAAARARALSEFSWQRHVSDVLALADAAVARRRSSGRSRESASRQSARS